jgi:hypothetical protein
VQIEPDFTAQVKVEVVSALFGMLGALAVAMIVYRLTRDDQWAIFRGERESGRQARQEAEAAQYAAVRSALRHEIDDNLRRLNAFWPLIFKPGESGADPGAPARHLVRTAVPVWSMAVWQGAATTVANALPQDQLIDAYRLYATLADILETQRRLQAAAERDMAQYVGQPEHRDPLGTVAGGYKFQVSDNIEAAAKMLMPDIDAKVKVVLERGNPVVP